MLVTVLGTVVLTSGLAGVRLRQWVWVNTAPIRFTGDIDNAFVWGRRIYSDARALSSSAEPPVLADQSTEPVGWRDFLVSYVGLYQATEQARPAGNYALDYPPLRLLAMSAWVRGVLNRDPHSQGYYYDEAAPLLAGNVAAEAASALLAAMLVWMWVRTDQAMLTKSDANRAVLLGLTAGLLVWFNPAAIYDAHGWPQWDVWLVPFYLMALVCASSGWWLSAGLAIAVGAMLKGQILLVAPVLVVWPIMQWNWSAAVRGVIGLVAGMSAIALPWLAQEPAAWIWLGCMGLAVWLAWLAWNLRGWWWFAAATAVVMGLVIWPWLRAAHQRHVWVGVLVIAVLLAGARLVPRRHAGAWAAAVLAAAAMLSAGLFDGTFAWLRIGFGYATRHHPAMHMGPVCNLAGILADRFGWGLTDVAWTVPTPLAGTTQLSIRSVLIAVYAVALLLCGLAAARHQSRRDTRILVALAAPWVLMYALLPQMHERYLVWGAMISAIVVGASRGLTLLHILLSAVALAMMVLCSLYQNPSAAPGLQRILDRLHPDVGWAVLLCAAIYLYIALSGGTRRSHLAIDQK
jgi:hypothetical protein